MIGKTISHYRIVEKLGEGGMGVVYKAEDTKLKRSVALKFLPRELDAHEPERARFLQEARAASALNHPNICNVHALGEHLGQQFIDMEYVDGVTLRGKIQEAGMKIQEAIAYAIQIGEALQEAHSKGVVHRDVKPENIMVNTKNQIKVMDFGLAKLKGSLKLTKTSSTVGTLAYMAPEQIEGREVDARSDIFSFGIVLYEMLTGKRPFRGDQEGAMINSILNDDPEPIQKYCPDVSSELIHILGRALEKDPEDRYPNVHEMLIDLRRAKKETSRVSRRSLATVTAEQPLPSAPGALGVPTEAGVHAAEVGRARVETVSSRPRLSGKRLILYVAPPVLVIGAALAIYFLHPLRPPTSPAKRVAIVPFENQTGDPTLDPLGRMVADWTTQSLLQSGLAEVVSPERLSQIEEGRSPSSIARAMGASTIVTGTYYKTGETIQFQAKVLSSDERVLQAIGPVSSQASNIMEGVGAVRQAVLGALAPLLNEKLREWWYQGAKPPSYEAYQQYMQGMELFETRRDWNGSLEYFKRAYAADTSFVMALINQSIAYSNLLEYARADSLVRILDERRTQLAPIEKLMLDEIRSWLSGDHLSALDAARRLARMAPGSMWAYQWGSEALATNQPEECLEALGTLDPEGMWLPYWGVLTWAYHSLGEYEKELEAAKRARELFPTELGALNMEIRALIGPGRIDDAKRLVEESLTFPKQASATPGGTMRLAAEELRAHGHEEVAMAVLDQAIQWYKSRPAEEMTFRRRGTYAVTLYCARRWDEAKSAFEDYAREAPKEPLYERAFREYRGLIAARQGDRDEALQISDWLKNVKQPYLLGDNTVTRASIAAILGDKDQAITLLKQSFLEGHDYTTLHTDFDFESLWDYPPFKEILKPKG